MAEKKPTNLIELANDWEHKLAKCEAQKADLLAALKAYENPHKPGHYDRTCGVMQIEGRSCTERCRNTRAAIERAEAS